MVEKLAQAGQGGEFTPTPSYLYHIYHITNKVVVYAPAESAPPMLSYPYVLTVV